MTIMDTPVFTSDRLTSAVETQEQIRAKQLRRLAEIGGELTTESDIVFSGKRFVLPETVHSLGEAVRVLRQREKDEEQETRFGRVFKYRPYDGARATALAIRRIFGFTQGYTIQTFFGPRPPEFIEIATGVDTMESVPWGAMTIPGLEDTVVNLGASKDPELGDVFAVTVTAPRKYKFTIEGLFKVIGEILETESIYRGHAIDGAELPNFVDVHSVSPEDVVYTPEVTQQLEANVWSPIKHADILAKLGQPGKRTVLFEGPYGTGKSLAAVLTAQVAVENGWTFIIVRPGKDSLESALQTARMYQPSVVFFEDLDTVTTPGEDPISNILDMFDGIQTKGLRMSLVLTTNHAERIHKGMVRPGRLDAVIHVGQMDRQGVEKLAKRILGNALDPDVDFDAVYAAMTGYMPAFVREAFDRSLRYSVAVNDGVLGPIDTEALVGAANGLRAQLALMEGASDGRERDTVGAAIRREVLHALDGQVHIYNEDDDYVVGRIEALATDRV